MAKLVYGMNVSLDGYVDHDHPAFLPDAALFDHFIGQMRATSGCLYGRRLYDLMRYWDDDQPGWTAAERDFALAWRAPPKWVVTHGADPLGPNAHRIEGDLATAVRRIKADHPGTVEVGGPDLAQQLGTLGLVDAYQLFLHPVVLGHGTPFFAGPLPRLHLTATDRIGPEVIRLTYVPA